MRKLIVVLLGSLAAMASAGVQALNVAVFNPENAAGFSTALTGYGHTVTTLSEAQVAAGVNAYDVLVLDHIDSFSPASCTSITNFLNAGKRLVTGWNPVWNLFSGSGPGLYYNQGTQCGLFPGTVGQGSYVGSGLPVTAKAPLQQVLTGLPNPIQIAGGTDYFYLVTGYNPAVWTIASTYDGWALTGNPAIMNANFGAGQVVAAVFDFGDNVGGDATANLLLNNLVTRPLAAAAPAGPAVLVPALDPVMLGVLALALFTLTFGLRRRIRRSR